ncbi:hypothetical protein TNCV_2268601 [Trichonephila clavipes]|nr:hypothetical protein TNCV_2268601 [Trichonephila clavipes]
MPERDQRRLMRIIKRNRRVTLQQIAADFNLRPLTSVTVQTIQRNIIIHMDFRAEGLLVYPCWTNMTQRFTPHLGSSILIFDRKHVAWSDESRSQLNRADGRVRAVNSPSKQNIRECYAAAKIVALGNRDEGVSSQTARNRLHEGGLYARRPMVCIPVDPTPPCGPEEDGPLNIEIGEQHDWSQVLFTDESQFSLESDTRRVLVWRDRGHF